jgi:hypothetical protein
LVWAERDGKLMPTQYISENYLKVEKKGNKQEGEDNTDFSISDPEQESDGSEDNTNEMEEREATETRGGDGNSHGGFGFDEDLLKLVPDDTRSPVNEADQITDGFEKLSVGSSLEKSRTPAGVGVIVDEELKRQIAEADRKFEELNKNAETKMAKPKSAKDADEGW